MSEPDATVSNDAGPIEELHGELVPTAVPVPIEAERAAGVVVAKQAAALAATSFAAGMVTVAAVRVTRARRERKRKARKHPVLATRSFLVDVHLLGSRD